MEEIARAMKVAGLEAEDEVADCHAHIGCGGDFRFERFETLKVISPFLCLLENDLVLSRANVKVL